MAIIFDLETMGLDRETIFASVPPFDRDNVKLGARKNPDVILAYMAEAEDSYYERWIERAALDPRTGTVLCIGIKSIGIGDKELEFKLLAGSENDILSQFWLIFGQTKEAHPFTRFIGFNIWRFDLPFLVRRSWHLGISVPGDVFDGRYWHRQFVDLMSYWSLGNREEMISLDHLARFFGLPPKTGNGKNFSRVWHEDKPKAIEYLKADLEITAQAAKKMGLL